MHDSRSHPLLEQVPLTVSPFVHLPRSTTLPYRYKTMPSALPPSLIDDNSSSKKPYVVAPSASAESPATAAHPDDILASCRALREHVARLQADAEAELRQFEERRAARDLAEKRRVAPGWLDSEERLLVPQRVQSAGSSDSGANGANSGGNSNNDNNENSAPQSAELAASMPGDLGEQLDRAFGQMRLEKGGERTSMS